MNTWIVGRILWVLSVLGLLSVSLAHAVMPLPNGSKFYAYPSSELPVVNANPSQAKPIGVGDVISTHDLILRIGLDSFSESVDIYIAIHAPAVLPDLFLFRADGSLAPLSSGLSPWKVGTAGPVNEGLLGTIPLSLIPSGDYAFYLLVAPAGTHAASVFVNCYLWVTSVGNLRVLDVSERAASLLGGDVQGAAAILMALGNDHDIGNVSKAVLGGRLTEYGEILSATAAERTPESENSLPSFCDPGASEVECYLGLISLFQFLLTELESATTAPFRTSPENQFERLVTAMTLYLASLGYDGKQIHEAIYGSFLGGETYVDIYRRTKDYPFGGIMKRHPDGEAYDWFVLPTKTVAGGLFSDLDPKDFDIPSTEGMTFPSYYKGTGAARIYYSNPSRGSIECTLQNVVFVAKVGGTGIWEGRLEVYSAVYPSYTSTGPLECMTGLVNNPNQPWRVAKGGYTVDGTYYEIFDTDTYSGVSDVKFNKWLLWGSATGTDTRALYGGDQVIEKEWHFELEMATEAEYKAVIPD